MDSGSLDRVTTLLMTLILEMSARVTAMVNGHKQELDLSQHGTIREDLKLSAEPTSGLKIKHIWITTLQDLKSSLQRVPMVKMVLDFSTQSLLVIQKFLI